MTTTQRQTTWQGKDPAFQISTEQALLDVDAVRAAFGSEMMWWAKAWDDAEAFKEMLKASLCFGLYHTEAGQTRMIGFARLVTDQHTFAYLTDLYIIKEYQGRGLGKWFITVMDDVVGSWPMARRLLYIADKKVARDFYTKLDGMTEVKMDGRTTYVEKVYKGFPNNI